MAADFTMGVWVKTVATVGVGAVEFTDAVAVGVVGMGWAIALTLYFLLAGTVLLLSLNLGFGAFLGCYFGDCTGAWLWLGLGLELGLGLGSGTKLTL